jgi:hypothetical protein
MKKARILLQANFGVTSGKVSIAYYNSLLDWTNPDLANNRMIS